MTQPEAGVVASVRSRELPADLKGAARGIADRKVMRFLDNGSLAPFIAATEVYRRQPFCSPDDVALFTVSGWDPSVPIPAFPIDDSAETQARLARAFYQPDNPTDWLRRMPNNALCQAAIVAGYRGPNMHFVGRIDALQLAAGVAVQMLVDRAAELALIVAYDQPPGLEHATPDEAASKAAAISLASHERARGLPPFQSVDLGAEDSASDAVTALDRFIDTLERPANEAVPTSSSE